MLAHYANVSSGLWCCSGWFIKWKERGKWNFFFASSFFQMRSVIFFMNISLCLLTRTLFNPNQRHSQKHFRRWKKKYKNYYYEWKYFHFRPAWTHYEWMKWVLQVFMKWNFTFCNLIFFFRSSNACQKLWEIEWGVVDGFIF